jgi:hypothetical protein
MTNDDDNVTFDECLARACNIGATIMGTGLSRHVNPFQLFH